MIDLSIIILSYRKLDKKSNCKHGQMRSRSSWYQIYFAHYTTFPVSIRVKARLSCRIDHDKQRDVIF